MKCQGRRRYKGVTSSGSPKWAGCENPPIVMLLMPAFSSKPMAACHRCWKELIACEGCYIQEVSPVPDKKDSGS